MTAEQFCFWLQGYMEITNPSVIESGPTQEIKRHLNLVFGKQEPPVKPIGIEDSPYLPPHPWGNPYNNFKCDIDLPPSNGTVVYKGTPISC